MQYGDTILNLDYKDFYKKSHFKDAISIYKNEEGLDNNNVLYKDKKLNYFNTESNMNLKILNRQII